MFLQSVMVRLQMKTKNTRDCGWQSEIQLKWHVIIMWNQFLKLLLSGPYFKCVASRFVLRMFFSKACVLGLAAVFQLYLL